MSDTSNVGMFNRLRCRLFGHEWDVGDPPWSGKQYLRRPECERCGHTPEQIAIAGSREVRQRV
jgi:hypothetical protein